MNKTLNTAILYDNLGAPRKLEGKTLSLTQRAKWLEVKEANKPASRMSKGSTIRLRDLGE